MNLFVILHFSLMGLALALCFYAYLIARKKKVSAWMKKHILINTAGALSAVCALLSMFYFKSSMAYPHFTSPHSLGGLATLVLLLSMPILGNLLLSGRKNLRQPHRVLGRVTIVLMAITAVFGALQIILQ